MILWKHKGLRPRPRQKRGQTVLWKQHLLQSSLQLCENGFVQGEYFSYQPFRINEPNLGEYSACFSSFDHAEGEIVFTLFFLAGQRDTKKDILVEATNDYNGTVIVCSG